VGRLPTRLGVIRMCARTRTRSRTRTCSLLLVSTPSPPPVSLSLSPLAINTSAFTSVASRVNATVMKRPHHRAAGPCSISSLPLGSSLLSSFSNARASVSSRCRIDEQMTLGRATMTRVFTRVRARTPLRRDVGGRCTTPRGCIRGCLGTHLPLASLPRDELSWSRSASFLKFYHTRIRKLC
jgi:hypothetical protein